MSSRAHVQTKKSSKNLTLLLIYVNIALYATCFQIQRPLEPFLVERLGLSKNSGGEYAKLQSFFSVMQTLGSLIAGPCLDRFGAKGGFFISFLASALSYILLSRATTLSLLYISKIPTIFQAGYMCAQLAASQATSDGAERVLALGRLSMSYTIGSVLGPILGATGDYYLGARIAVVGSFMSVLITYFIPNAGSVEVDKKNSSDNMSRDDVTDRSILLSDTDSSSVDGSNPALEQTSDSEKDGRFDEKDSSASPSLFQSLGNQVNSIMGVVAIAWLTLSVKIISSVANAMMSETFPLVLKNTFKLNEQYLGLAIAANSGFNGLVNGLLLAPMVAFSGGDLVRVIYLCLSSMATIAITLSAVFTTTLSDLVLSFSTSSSSTSLFIYLSFIFFLSIFQYALSTTITGQSTSMVRKTQKGTLLGVEHSFFALARVVAPQCGVTLLQYGGISAVAAASAAVYGATSLLWYTFQSTLKSPYKNHCKILKTRKTSTDKS